jgi:hypothetical protein
MFHVEHSGFKVQGSEFKIQAWMGDCFGEVNDLVVGVMFHVEHSRFKVQSLKIQAFDG